MMISGSRSEVSRMSCPKRLVRRFESVSSNLLYVVWNPVQRSSRAMVSVLLKFNSSMLS